MAMTGRTTRTQEASRKPVLSPFELEREENIRRNEAILESLGLGSGRSLLGGPAAVKRSKSRPTKAKKKTTTVS